MASIVRNGWAQSSGGTVALTADGQALAPAARPATTKELQAKIMAMLDGGEVKLLKLLIDIYPRAYLKADLAAEAGYSNPRSGGFSEPIAHLIDLGLAETPERGHVRGTSLLFVGGRR